RVVFAVLKPYEITRLHDRIIFSCIIISLQKYYQASIIISLHKICILGNIM
ncbi:hypothetical protein MKW92_010023, partial [Papaver armeniacum]